MISKYSSNLFFIKIFRNLSFLYIKTIAIIIYFIKNIKCFIKSIISFEHFPCGLIARVPSCFKTHLISVPVLPLTKADFFESRLFLMLIFHTYKIAFSIPEIVFLAKNFIFQIKY